MSFTTSSQGGEYKHLLSLNEMPSHAHRPHDWDVITAQGGNTGFYNMTYLGDNNRSGTFTPFIHDYDKNRYGSYVGNNEAHNVIQPYTTVFFWKRIK